MDGEEKQMEGQVWGTRVREKRKNRSRDRVGEKMSCFWL